MSIVNWNRVLTPWLYDLDSLTFYLNCDTTYFFESPYFSKDPLPEEFTMAKPDSKYNDVWSSREGIIHLILGPEAKGGLGELRRCRIFDVTLDPENVYYHIKNDLLFEMKNGEKSVHTVIACCVSNADITVPEGAVVISHDSFYGHFLNSISMPTSLVYIGDNAFYCTNLKTVKIPDSVTTISECAFYRGSIEDLTLGSDLETIGEEAFCNTKIKSVKISKKLKSFGLRAFGDCENLESIEIDNENNYYTSIDGVVYTKDKKTLVCYPAGKKDEEFTIPGTVTKIENYAFCGAKNLKKIRKPKMAKVDSYSFTNCKAEIVDYYMVSEHVIEPIKVTKPTGPFRPIGRVPRTKK